MADQDQKRETYESDVTGHVLDEVTWALSFRAEVSASRSTCRVVVFCHGSRPLSTPALAVRAS